MAFRGDGVVFLLGFTEFVGEDLGQVDKKGQMGVG